MLLKLKKLQCKILRVVEEMKQLLIYCIKIQEDKIMHDGCSGKFENGKQVVEKLRMMGFNEQLMPIPAQFICEECNNEITMDTFEYKCPHCRTIYAVTPCHAFDVENIMCAGKEE